MNRTEKAILAGGCFWGMQDLIRRLPGVTKTRVGYSGGEVPNATYRNHGTHAEGIEILFDPDRISFRRILEFFFQIHDPTTPDRRPIALRELATLFPLFCAAAIVIGGVACAHDRAPAPAAALRNSIEATPEQWTADTSSLHVRDEATGSIASHTQFSAGPARQDGQSLKWKGSPSSQSGPAGHPGP